MAWSSFPFGFGLGAFYGAFGGLLLGIGDGLVLAAVTCIAFFPLRRVRLYRRVIGTLTALLTLAGGTVLSGTVFGPTLNWLIVLPTLVATIAAWGASQIVARWYVAASGLR